MVFSSIEFLCAFLPAVLIIYSALSLLRGRIEEHRLLRIQNIFLLLASLVFYAYGEPVYILLMCFTALVSYAAALLFDKAGYVTRLIDVLIFVIIKLGYVLPLL